MAVFRRIGTLDFVHSVQLKHIIKNVCGCFVVAGFVQSGRCAQRQVKVIVGILLNDLRLQKDNLYRVRFLIYTCVTEKEGLQGGEQLVLTSG